MGVGNDFLIPDHMKMHLSHDKVTVRPAKTQISLGIRPVGSETSQCSQWVVEYPSFFHADSKDSDQTGRMSCRGFVMSRLKYTVSIAFDLNFQGFILFLTNLIVFF